MKSLSIALATRTRPGLLARTVTETLNHVREPNTRLVILADDDDVGTRSLKNRLTDPRIVWSIEPKPDSLGTKFNRVMKVAPADVYLTMVDYAPEVTVGFDSKILEAASVYSDGYAVVLNYLANHSFSQINAVTHKLATKMGGIYPEYFPYWFVDHWFEEIAKRIGRAVFVETWRDCTRKQPTMGLKDPQFWGSVFQWLEPERAAIAESVLNAEDFKVIPEEHKAALRRNAALINHWSFLINSTLEAGPTNDGSDPAYNRLFEAAHAIAKARKAKSEAEVRAA